MTPTMKRKASIFKKSAIIGVPTPLRKEWAYALPNLDYALVRLSPLAENYRTTGRPYLGRNEVSTVYRAICSRTSSLHYGGHRIQGHRYKLATRASVVITSSSRRRPDFPTKKGIRCPAGHWSLATEGLGKRFSRLEDGQIRGRAMTGSIQ